MLPVSVLDELLRYRLSWPFLRYHRTTTVHDRSDAQDTSAAVAVSVQRQTHEGTIHKVKYIS